jgi:hypothetical protein
MRNWAFTVIILIDRMEYMKKSFGIKGGTVCLSEQDY